MKTRSIRRFVAVVVLLGTVPISLAQEGMWTDKADMPTRRLCVSSSVVDGKVYVIGGGYSIEGPHSRIVEAYDPVTDSWSRKADMPTGRLGHAAGVVNGKVYVIGGDLHEMDSGATVEEYDPATDTWTKKADMPSRRTFLCACAVQGKIYVLGGITAPEMHMPASVEVYDPTTDTWTTKAGILTARSMAAGSVVDGKIYVLGGVIGDVAGAGVSAVEEYDPATNTWARKADMPTRRKALSASTLAGKIYAAGGGTGHSEPFSALEEYDPATDIWTRKGDMPTARYCHSTSTVDGKMYVFGGAVQYPPHTSTSAVEGYALVPPPSDFNGDGTVDGKDVLILAEHWGLDDPMCDIAPPPFGDGIVDLQDLIALADYIGQEVNDPTLIAHWALDEADGTVACDSAGENDATILGVPLWQPEAGKVGGALEFDGTTFVVADSVLSPADGPFSVLAWVKGGAENQAIISQTDGANWLMVDASGVLMTELSRGGRLGRPLVSDTVVTDGHWHRVGFTWDGSTRNLYVDEGLVAQDTDTGLADCHGDLNLGCGQDMTPDSFFTGLMDEVRVYNRAVKP